MRASSPSRSAWAAACTTSAASSGGSSRIHERRSPGEVSRISSAWSRAGSDSSRSSASAWGRSRRPSRRSSAESTGHASASSEASRLRSRARSTTAGVMSLLSLDGARSRPPHHPGREGCRAPGRSYGSYGRLWPSLLMQHPWLAQPREFVQPRAPVAPRSPRAGAGVPTASTSAAGAIGTLVIGRLVLLHLLLARLQVLHLVLDARVLALEPLLLVLDLFLRLLDRREALLDLPERAIDVADRLLAVAPVVVARGLQLALRLLEVRLRRLHLRMLLSQHRASREDEPCCNRCRESLHGVLLPLGLTRPPLSPPRGDLNPSSAGW